MNAYELADELNRKLTGKLIGRTAAKLRQQADRIAELEKAQRFIQNFAEEQHHRACALEEAQTKLSDEEKLEIIHKWSESKGMREQDLIGLCDAIEERILGK